MHHNLTTYLNILDELGRIATYDCIGRDVFGYHSACRHHGIFTDGYAGKNGCAGTDPGIAADAHRFAQKDGLGSTLSASMFYVFFVSDAKVRGCFLHIITPNSE